jgi:hypothetical protein
VTLRLYFGEVKVSEFKELFQEAVDNFSRLGVPYDSVVLASNRAGMHFNNFLRLDHGAAEALRERLDAERWKQASD